MRETLAVLEQARDCGDPRVILAAIREQRANLELVGRLKGELVAGGIMAIVMRFGARDEADLEQLVAAGRQYRDSQNRASRTVREYFNSALEMMVLCCRREPELLSLARERLRQEGG